MPYVEGFGTWPFGEEWLCEAIADRPTCRCSTCCEAGAAADALADAGAGRPARGARRDRALPRLPARRARHLARARHRGARRRARRWRPSSSARRATTRAPPSACRERPARRAGAATPPGRAPPRTRVLPLLATDAGVRLQVRTGIEAHRRALRRRLARRLLAAGMRPRAVAGPAARGGRRARDVRRPHRRLRTAATRATCARWPATRAAARADRPRGDRSRVGAERLPVARRLPRLTTAAPSTRPPPVGQRRRRL